MIPVGLLVFSLHLNSGGPDKGSSVRRVGGRLTGMVMSAIDGSGIRDGSARIRVRSGIAQSLSARGAVLTAASSSSTEDALADIGARFGQWL